MFKPIDRVVRPVCFSLLMVSITLPIRAADRSAEEAMVSSVPREASGRSTPSRDPFALVSSESLLSYLEDLTEIEPHSGWRVCGSEGEREAFRYVERRLGQLSFLSSLGLQLERQHMRTIAGVEMHESRLELEIDGYDEAWTAAEVSVLVDYVEDGGLLILTNSAARLGPFARARETNEDMTDLNDVASEFGVRYQTAIAADTATTVGDHALVEGVDELTMIGGNGVSLAVEGGFNTLARSGDDLAAVRLDVGGSGGEVVALADIGILVSRGGAPTNFTFWQNLVHYARNRESR